MRPEKQYLVMEVEGHLDKSNYVFVTDYSGITVPETAELRALLSKTEAEFHVVKNSALNVATKKRELPDISENLSGQTAIVTGGENPSETAKALLKFGKDIEKATVKVGIMDGNVMSPEDVTALSKLPGKDELRAQLLSLFNTPATQFVRVANGVPQALLNVIDAKRRKDAGEE